MIPGKVVLITGASRGIGLSCAQAFGSRSASLSLTARTLVEHPASALFTAGDITVAADRERIVGATVERFGRIDILINNAGQGIYGSALATDLEEARKLFELNFFAPLAMIQLVVPHMRKQGSGTIVNVSSIGGQIALPWMPVYSASKFALGALTDGLRAELRTDGIRAMTVCPGYVNTPFHENAVGKPPAGISGAKRFAISADQCAEAIARGVEREARTVVTPGAGWILLWLRRFFPTIVDSRLSSLSR